MDENQLQQLVEQISLHSFAKPFRHRASFNTRLRTTGGRYLLQSHNIELNKKYYDQFGMEELVRIIKHELCHYHLHLEGRGYRHQDADFKQLLQDVDAPRFCRPLPDAVKRRQTKYTYVCRSCGQTYIRRKSMDVKKYLCGKCGGRIKKLEEKC